MTYEEFAKAIETALQGRASLTWTDIRTNAKLPQAFPNNQWVRRLEQDIGLVRKRDSHGVIRWSLG